MKKMIISAILCVLFTLAGCWVWLMATAGIIAKEWYMLLVLLGSGALIASALFEEGRKEYKASRHA